VPNEGWKGFKIIILSIYNYLVFLISGWGVAAFWGLFGKRRQIVKFP
jgi:hypothetical protein